MNTTNTLPAVEFSDAELATIRNDILTASGPAVSPATRMAETAASQRPQPANITSLVADHIAGVHPHAQVEVALIHELKNVLPAEYNAIRLVKHDGKARSATVYVDLINGALLEVRCFADGTVGATTMPTATVPFVFSEFDLHECGRTGSGRVTARVHGYWSSDSITLYIERKVDWCSDDRKAEWVCTMSHSSGGRDTEAVRDDMQASHNFGAALIELANIGKGLRDPATAIALEVRYQAEFDRREALRTEAAATKQAKVSVDLALGEDVAARMIKQAVAKVKAEYDPAWGYSRAVATIFSPRRAEEQGATITVFQTRNGVTRVEINSVASSSKEAAALLAKNSHRAAFVAPVAA